MISCNDASRRAYSDLSNNHSTCCPDDAACNIADVAVDLIQTVAISNDDGTDIEQKLDRLQYVDAMTSGSAVDTESNVSKGLHRVSVRIEVEEHCEDCQHRVLFQLVQSVA